MMNVIKYANGTVKLDGFEGRYLQAVLEAMGFNYDIVIPEDLEWGFETPDGNWTGMVGMVQREADLAFTFINLNEQRSKVIDYSNSYSAAKFVFISQMPENIRPTMAFLYPFHLNTWIVICVALMTISAIFAKLDGPWTAWESLASIIGQPLSIETSSLKFKVSVALWFLMTRVIILSYSATLLSFLVLPLKGPYIQTFYELSKAVQTESHQAYFTKIQYFVASEIKRRISRQTWQDCCTK
ncbi:glutamate receptor ionotropic, delta-1 [Caerostris extrusa]|uniref:Glutamate receptor ionotropic, delta-1 n=1 Tax=Caerostris extrusa TaxID=172846 RepID=A0AAV4MX32_CAEEX|nr:glutamate receptor ionotropic, delta-1 [Caerostris extrusa]